MKLLTPLNLLSLRGLCTWYMVHGASNDHTGPSNESLMGGCVGGWGFEVGDWMGG